MTITELIEKLKIYPKDLEVYIQDTYKGFWNLKCKLYDNSEKIYVTSMAKPTSDMPDEFLCICVDDDN